MDHLPQGPSAFTHYDRPLLLKKSNHVFLWSKTADETDKKKNKFNHLFLYFIFVSDHPLFSIYILINHASIILGWKGSDTNLKTGFLMFYSSEFIITFESWFILGLLDDFFYQKGILTVALWSNFHSPKKWPWLDISELGVCAQMTTYGLACQCFK